MCARVNACCKCACVLQVCIRASGVHTHRRCLVYSHPAISDTFPGRPQSIEIDEGELHLEETKMQDINAAFKRSLQLVGNTGAIWLKAAGSYDHSLVIEV